SFLFTENDNNNERLFGGQNASRYVKDGINDFVVQGRQDSINPAREGTKASAQFHLNLEPGESVTTTLRLSNLAPDQMRMPFRDAERIVADRKGEADAFYAAMTPASVTADGANVMRQALAGMLWSKQHYLMDLNRWLDEHGAGPFSGEATSTRNHEWGHM